MPFHTADQRQTKSNVWNTVFPHGTLVVLTAVVIFVGCLVLYSLLFLSHAQSGWKESLATFNNELKYMKASGTSTLGVALKETFDLLNLQRASAGTDTYGAVGGKLYPPWCDEIYAFLSMCDITE